MEGSGWEDDVSFSSECQTSVVVTRDGNRRGHMTRTCCWAKREE